MLIWREIPQGWLAVDESSGLCVAGLGGHWHRPWIYPLYTPRGRQVLHAFPFDHPFHNGCFAGIHPIEYQGRAHNFWATPPQRQDADPMMQGLGRVLPAAPPDLKVDGRQWHAQWPLNWWTDDGCLLMREERTVRIEPGLYANRMHVQCHWTANVPLKIPATKFAGLGVRLDTALTQAAGARYAPLEDAEAFDALALGAAESGADLVRLAGSVPDASVDELHGRALAAIRVQSAINGDSWGVVLHQARPAVPWFIRGYGLALHNPVQAQAVEMTQGQQMEWSIALTAYDLPGAHQGPTAARKGYAAHGA